MCWVSLVTQLVKNPPAMQGWSECESHSVVSDSCDPMDCSPPASSVQGILQARILGWVAISFSRQCRGPGFNPLVGKIPWRRERLPTPGFWPREFHGLYSPWGCKESDTTEQFSLSVSNIDDWENWLTLSAMYLIICSTLAVWRRQWQPTPVLLPGKSHGQRNLVGCCPWGRTESDTTEAT